MIAAPVNPLPVGVGTNAPCTVVGPRPGSGLSVCLGGPGNDACQQEVKDDEQGVQCDLCGNWYHAFCQDITKGAYNALKRHTILSFICDLCKKLPTYAKLQPGPQLSDTAVQVSPSHDQPQPNVISELVKKVGDLEMAMKNHLLAMASTTPQQLGATQVPPNPSKNMVGRSYSEALRGTAAHQQHIPQRHNQPPSQSAIGTEMSGDYRRVVREELRELEERKKRQNSLVIRGLRVKTAAEAVDKFKEISEILTGERVTITEVCQIKSDTDLFRGNVHNIRQRNLILDHARYLRNTQHSHVYIRKDLTYIQRQELHDRLASRARQTEWHRTAPVQGRQPEAGSSGSVGQPDEMVETIPKQYVASPSVGAPPCTDSGEGGDHREGSQAPEDTLPESQASQNPQPGSQDPQDAQPGASQNSSQGNSGN